MKLRYTKITAGILLALSSTAFSACETEIAKILDNNPTSPKMTREALQCVLNNAQKGLTVADFQAAAPGADLTSGVILDCATHFDACQTLAKTLPAPQTNCNNAWTAKSIYVRQIPEFTGNNTDYRFNQTNYSTACYGYIEGGTAVHDPFSKSFKAESSAVGSLDGQVMPLFSKRNNSNDNAARFLVCERVPDTDYDELTGQACIDFTTTPTLTQCEAGNDCGN